MTHVVYNYINCFVDKLLTLALVTNYTTNYYYSIIVIVIWRDLYLCYLSKAFWLNDLLVLNLKMATAKISN